MKTEELGEKLAKRGIPRKWYSLNGYSEEAFCIEKLKEGDWGFYYGERGLKEPITHLQSEEDACAELWTRMLKKWDRVKETLLRKKQ
jgi:hypothetical protein